MLVHWSLSELLLVIWTSSLTHFAIVASSQQTDCWVLLGSFWMHWAYLTLILTQLQRQVAFDLHFLLACQHPDCSFHYPTSGRPAWRHYCTLRMVLKVFLRVAGSPGNFELHLQGSQGLDCLLSCSGLPYFCSSFSIVSLNWS